MRAADEVCEGSFVALGQISEFDKLPANIRCFHIVGLVILSIVLLICFQCRGPITTDAEEREQDSPRNHSRLERLIGLLAWLNRRWPVYITEQRQAIRNVLIEHRLLLVFGELGEA